MNKLKVIFIAVTALALTVSCGIYTFTGASIGPEVKTFSVQTFVNVAPMVAPSLSTSLTDELVNRYIRQTSLTQERIDGDFAFEGTITGYTTSAVAVTNESAVLNKLTITIMVKFTNRFDPKASFQSSFSQYAEYDSNQSLQSVEQQLLPEIIDKLVTDIFLASASNW